MAVRQLYLERTAIPEQAVAVVTRWLHVVDEDEPTMAVMRRSLRERDDHDPLIMKDTVVYAGTVQDGRFVFERDKAGNPRALGQAPYRYSDPLAALQAGHRLAVLAIKRGDLGVRGNTRLSRCLLTLLRSSGEPTPPAS